MILLPPPLKPLVAHLFQAGVRPIFVGGFVRDHFTGGDTHDVDIELYGIKSLETVETLLKPFGRVNLVGKSFGVLKLSFGGYHIDFSPPRTESKHGSGHKGFDVSWHSDIDFTEAARRRDFTINAIGYDPIAETFLDPYGGIGDLEAGRLRCVDPETFVDDPLRVLRAVQFAGRFEFACDDSLLKLCRRMIAEGALEELPKERIFEEFKKLLLRSRRPSIGLELLRLMGGLDHFPPLEKFEHTPQDPASHPEGSVWTHILMCVDAMVSLLTGEMKKDTVLMFAALLHDIAKPFTTLIAQGSLNAPKHAEEGVDVAREWLLKLTEDRSLIEAILPLIRYHGWPRKLYRSNAADTDILRLSTQVCIDDLIRVAEADFFGRDFLKERPACFEAGKWLCGRAETLGVLHEPPHPLIMGRDLIAMGLIPSEAFKTLLDAAYEAQLNLEFTVREEALKWAENHLVTEL